MSKNLSPKIAKYETIVKKLEENQQVWQAIGALQNSVNDIKNCLATLQIPETEKKPRGRAPKMANVQSSEAIKKERKNTLVKKTITLAGALYAYAIDSQNNEIKILSFLNRVKMEKKNDKQAAQASTELLEVATNKLQELAYYGVEKEELTLLESAITAFKEVAGRRKAVAIEAEDATAKVKINVGKVLKEIDAILEDKVDKLLYRFQDSHPDFYKSYHRTRYAMNKATTKTAKTATESDTPPVTDGEPKPRRGRPKKAAVEA